MTSRTPRPPPLYRLVNLDTVESTNAEAKRLADGGADEWTLVWARTQTAGRGRHGRIWESPEGNLYCSLLLRPGCPPGQAAEIGFVAGLAIYDAIGSLVLPGLEAWCKWPNDVLLGDDKVAGVLLEVSGTDWLVLGVGINVAHYPAATDSRHLPLAAGLAGGHGRGHAGSLLPPLPHLVQPLAGRRIRTHSRPLAPAR